MDLLKVTMGVDSFHDGSIVIVGYDSLGYKHRRPVDVFTAFQTFLYIVDQTLCIIAAILLDNGHLAVNDLNTGFQIQQVGTQSSGRGAAAALDQIVQLVHQEAGFHFLGISLQLGSQRIQMPRSPDRWSDSGSQ